MDRMLGELLQLSRLESGQTPFHMAPVDLAAFAKDVASRFQPIADSRGVSLRWEVHRPVPLVTADADKLHQLLGNLIGNALKATPTGGSITITVERADRLVEIRVSDTGTGIEPQHLPHIFERFYKADRSRSDDGAGLGLAIAKHIALAHQGEISVRSRPGEGSAFIVRLPVPVGFE
jgi:signal transduction histidine kinase